MALKVPKYEYGLTCKAGLVSGPFTQRQAKMWQVYCNDKFSECRPHRIILWKDRKDARNREQKTKRKG